ncbi:MAG: carboxypeptidase regulatory-like domain-containing protein [Candidatus Cloacimonadaceae bacterium]|jgi:hypothetical protein
MKKCWLIFLSLTLFTAVFAYEVVAWHEDFEGDISGWTHYDGTLSPNMWHIHNYGGTQGNVWWMGDPSLAQGSNIGGYYNAQYLVLDTPARTLTANNATLTFKMRYKVEDPGQHGNYNVWDSMNIRISTDNGATWSVISGTPAYSGTSSYAFGQQHSEGPGVPAWGGSLLNWTTATFSLSAYVGQSVKVRFAFASDPRVCTADDRSMFGWMVDDIYFGGYTNNGVDDGQMTYSSMVPIGGDLWHLTTANDAPSPTHVMWCQNAQGSYNPHMLSYLVSPPIQLPSNGDIRADFMIKGSFNDPGTFPDVDYHGWEISVDDGVAWYAMSNPYGNPSGSNYVYTDVPSSWISMVEAYNAINGYISDYAGQTVRFRWYFKSNDTVDGTGYMIDDVKIYVDEVPTNHTATVSGNNVALNWQFDSYSSEWIGYRVWRLLPGQEDNEDTWTSLTPSYITQTNYTDTSWQAQPAGVYKYAVKAVYSNDIYSDPAFSNELYKGVVFIGTGTADIYDPFNVYYGYGRSLGLYTAAQIGQPGLINCLGWSVARSSGVEVPYKIYVKLTAETELMQMTWDEFTSTATLVKEGTYTFDTVGWHEFFLDTFFDYTGGNLLIGVETNYGDTGTSGYPRFHYTAGTAGSHQYWRRDNSIPTGAGNLNANLPNLMMMLSAPSEDPVILIHPTQWDFGHMTFNTTANRTFTIVNGGGGTLNLSAADISIIGPQAAQFSFDAGNLPFSLTTGQSGTIPVFVTGNTAGPISATLRIVYEGTNYDVALTADVLPEGLVFIGDGTSNQNLPIYPYYNYSYSQTIYLQSDINVANKRIENIAFYWNGANVGTNSRDWVVYMAHTDRTTFSGTSDWVPFDQLTQVFAGELNIPAEEGWINITLQNPFFYNNTDNLLICVDENTDGNSGSSAYFHSTTVDGTRALLYRSDGTNPDPANPPNATNQKGAYANIRMQFGDLPTAPVFTYNPQSLDFGTVSNGVETGPLNVTVTNTGGGTLNLSAANVSMIGPQAAQFSFDDANLPMALGTGVSATIPVYVTGITAGPISATLRMVHGGENHDVALTADVLPEVLVFVGDGTSYNDHHTYPAVYGGYWKNAREQYIVTAAELTAAGAQAGFLASLAFDVQSPNNCGSLPNFSIRLGTTTATEFADNYFLTDLTEVYSATNYTPIAGLNNHAFTTPFYWDGSSNLVIQTSFGMLTNYTTNASTYYTSTEPVYRAMYYRHDSTAWDTVSTGTPSYNRPNLLLGFLNTGTISGTVMGANNLPLAGVNITLAERQHHATTNDAGQYQFLYIPAGNYTLTFSKQGYQDYTQNLVLATDDEQVINVNMQLLPPVTVSGRIVRNDQPGVGVADAIISLSGFESYSATTNAQGQFSIPNVYADQTYQYVVTATGFQAKTGQAVVGTTNLNLGDIILSEMALPPHGVQAVENASSTHVDVSWQAFDPNALQITEGFEGETFPPPGWTQVINNTHTDENSYGIAGTWGRVGTSYIAPLEGQWQAGLWWSDSPQDEWLITPEFACPSNCMLIFDSIVYYGSTWNDHYYIKISTDGGSSWTVLWDASTLTGGWNRYDLPISVSLADYAGQQVKLAWHALSTSSDIGLYAMWFIDNVIIGNADRTLRFNTGQLISQMEAQQYLYRKPSLDNIGIDLPISQGLMNNPDLVENRISVPERRNERVMTGYRVWRLPQGQEENEATWTSLTPSSISATNYTDTGWQTLDTGVYRYAVKAAYTGNIYSIPAFSNEIQKVVWGVLSGTVTESGTNLPVEGATVTAGEYSGVTNAQGVYSFSVGSGTYEVSCFKPRYYTATQTGVVIVGAQTTTQNFVLTEIIMPPENVMAEIAGDNVDLTWDEPGPTVGEWLSYCGEQRTGYGLNGSGTLQAAIRYPVHDLRNYVGMSLQAVKVWPTDNATFSARVWTGGTDVYPGTQVVEQPFNPELNVYNTIVLTNPVEITGNEELWFGYSATHEYGRYPIGVDYGPAIEGFGGMVNFGGVWKTLYLDGDDYNWCIQGLCGLRCSHTCTQYQPQRFARGLGWRCCWWRQRDGACPHRLPRLAFIARTGG